MKKVISFVLVLALVLGSFSMAFAVPADVEGTDYENAVTALTELGVVTGYPDGTYKPANAVTRAEAAKLVITALGLADYAAGNTASFTDLEGYGWAKGYIGYAEALGILKGDGNGKFRPADTVSYQEMATMLVRACGYTDASLPGTWPANYVVKAKALGIMDGIAQAGDAAANRGDVAVMLFNNLENRIGTINLDNQWVANTPADTMMTRLDQELYDPDGTATAAAMGTAFILDNNDPVAEGVNVKAYYGAYVVAYANADNEITGIKEVKSTFLTGKFTTDTAVKFIADEVTYSVNDDYQNSIFNNGLVVGTTGAALTISNAEVDNELTIAVDLSGKKIKEVYSIADWTANDVRIWDSSDAKNLDKNYKIGSLSFDETDDEVIDTTSFELVGAETLDKIAEGAVVTTYRNGYITKVEVSTTTVEGKVTKINSDNEYVINGTAYATAAAVDGDVSLVDLGSEGTFKLDYAGNIVDFEGVAKTENYAVVVNVIREYKEAGYDTTTKYAVELFTATGEQKVFEIDDEATVSGGAVTSTALAQDLVITYTLDKDGLIDEINVKDKAPASGTKYTAKGFLNGIEVAKNVVVITGTAGNDDFAVGSIADVPVAETLGANTYYVLNDDADQIVFIIANETVEETPYGVVISYATVENADEEDVLEVVMYVDGVEKTYLTTRASAAAVKSAIDANATSLFAIGLTDEEITAFAATGVAIETVSEVKNGSIKTSGGAFEEVCDDVVVYEIVEKADGSFDKWVVSNLDAITEDDTVQLFDTNTEEGHDGYDVIIFKAD